MAEKGQTRNFLVGSGRNPGSKGNIPLQVPEMTDKTSEGVTCNKVLTSIFAGEKGGQYAEKS